MIDEIARLVDEAILIQRAVADLPPYRIGDLANFPNQSQAEICQHLEARAEPTRLRDGGGPLSVFIDCHDFRLLPHTIRRVQATIGRQAELNRNPGDGGPRPNRAESGPSSGRPRTRLFEAQSVKLAARARRGVLVAISKQQGAARAVPGS